MALVVALQARLLYALVGGDPSSTAATPQLLRWTAKALQGDRPRVADAIEDLLRSRGRELGRVDVVLRGSPVALEPARAYEEFACLSRELSELIQLLLEGEGGQRRG